MHFLAQVILQSIQFQRTATQILRFRLPSNMIPRRHPPNLC